LWRFNKLTINLPTYIVVCVHITINDNRSFTFFIDSFSITFALSILRFKIIKKEFIIDKYVDKEISCIYLKDMLNLCIYKFPKKNIKDSFFIMLGVLKSMEIFIVKPNKDFYNL
jgi:hypothetical protein